jgi:hypothetical protein
MDNEWQTLINDVINGVKQISEAVIEIENRLAVEFKAGQMDTLTLLNERLANGGEYQTEATRLMEELDG